MKRPSLVLKYYKYTKTLQLFAKDTNTNYLQKLSKMPGYEGLGWLRLFMKLGFKHWADLPFYGLPIGVSRYLIVLV